MSFCYAVLMISEKDIEKIESRFRQIFVTKVEFFELVVKVDNLEKNQIVIISMLDGIAKGFAELRMEYASLNVSDNRQNRHIAELADHVDLKLER